MKSPLEEIGPYKTMFGYVGFPVFLGLGLEDGHVPAFWPLRYGRPFFWL